MEKYEKYAAAALALGFTHAVSIDGLALTCEADIRAYCNPEQCPSYGGTWVCPPGCGTVEECQARASSFGSAVVLQTVISTAGKPNIREIIENTQREHNLRFLRLADNARSDGHRTLPLTTGGCIICKSCTFPDSPCREVERRMHSLSAYGIDVGKLCAAAGLEYAFTEGTVYFVACLLLE